MSTNKRNVGVIALFAATIAGLGFGFLGSIINSKMLTKEEFGDWKYIQNYLFFISYIINFGFYTSGARLIASTNDVTKIKRYKGYMLYSTILGFAIMVVATIIIGLTGTRILNSNVFKLLLIMIPLFIIHPWSYYLEAIFQAQRRMISFAIYKAAPPVLYVLILQIFHNQFNGNIYFTALLYYILFFVIYGAFVFIDKFSFPGKTEELSLIMTENKQYGIQIYYGSLWNVGSSYLLPILVGYFSSNNTNVGYYALALNFTIPLTFLPSIVGTSYFKDFINANKIPQRAIKSVLLCSVGLLLITVVGIDYALKWFLDKRFAQIGLLVQIAATPAILHGLGDFINKFLSAKGKGTFIRNVAIIVGAVQILSGVLLIMHYSSLGAIIARSLGSTIYCSALFFHYVKNYHSKNIIEQQA